MFKVCFVLLAQAAFAQLTFDDGTNWTLTCAYQSPAAFGVTSHTSYRHDDCGTLEGELFAMDIYLFPVFLGVADQIQGYPPFQQEGLHPCNIESYLSPSYINGKIAFVHGVWKCVCNILIGQKPILIFGPNHGIADDKLGGNGGNHLMWMRAQGVKGILWVVPDNSNYPYVTHVELAPQDPNTLFSLDSHPGRLARVSVLSPWNDRLHGWIIPRPEHLRKIKPKWH